MTGLDRQHDTVMTQNAEMSKCAKCANLQHVENVIFWGGQKSDFLGGVPKTPIFTLCKKCQIRMQPPVEIPPNYVLFSIPPPPQIWPIWGSFLDLHFGPQNPKMLTRREFGNSRDVYFDIRGQNCAIADFVFRMIGRKIKIHDRLWESIKISSDAETFYRYRDVPSTESNMMVSIKSEPVMIEIMMPSTNLDEVWGLDRISLTSENEMFQKSYEWFRNPETP